MGFDYVHLKLCMLCLCFLIHGSTYCAILAGDIIKIKGDFIQAETEQSMSTKLLYLSHKDNSIRDPVNYSFHCM